MARFDTLEEWVAWSLRALPPKETNPTHEQGRSDAVLNNLKHEKFAQALARME